MQLNYNFYYNNNIISFVLPQLLIVNLRNNEDGCLPGYSAL
jgi:hypothetical protein